MSSIVVTDSGGREYNTDTSTLNEILPEPYRSVIEVVAFPDITVTRERYDYIDLDLDRNNTSLTNDEAENLITALRGAIARG